MRLSEFERFRGSRLLDQRLGELRCASPDMSIIEDLRPYLPYVSVRMTSGTGQRVTVSVDPLGMLARAGVQRPASDDDSHDGSGWA